MKKKVGLLVSLLAVFLFLGGCSGNQNTATTTEKTKTEETQKKKVVLYVTRHGKTMFNEVHRAQGWADTPLTEKGVKVAEDLGKGLKKEKVKFSYAYSSDAGRARETAKTVLKNAGQEKITLNEMTTLREVCFGIYEGDTDENMWGAVAKKVGYKDMDDLLKNYDKVGLEKSVDTIAELDTLKEAENFDTVKSRMQNSLKQIAKKAEKNGGGNILVVAHGMSILSMISDMTDKEIPTQLENASVTKITYENNAFTVNTINDLTYSDKGKSN